MHVVICFVGEDTYPVKVLTELSTKADMEAAIREDIKTWCWAPDEYTLKFTQQEGCMYVVNVIDKEDGRACDNESYTVYFVK